MLTKDSCLKCSRFLLCLDKRKGPKHRCNSFLKLKDLEHVGELADLPLVPSGQTLKGSLESSDDPDDLVDNESNEFYDAMKRAYDPLTGVANDVKLDFSGFDLADNIYDFATRLAGKAIKVPFARQLWILVHFCGEYCPRCADSALNDIYAVDVDDDPHEVAERLCLLKKGVCPKCGVTKAKLVLENELRDYQDLILVLGQRSGKSTIVAILIAYWYHRLLMVPKLSEICSGIQDFTPITGTLIALSFNRAERLLWNPVKEVISNSKWYCLAGGTKVALEDGNTKLIENIVAGDRVKTLEGSGEVTVSCSTGIKECVEVHLSSGHSLVGTLEHRVLCVSLDGSTLEWKTLAELTESDQVVIESEINFIDSSNSNDNQHGCDRKASQGPG